MSGRRGASRWAGRGLWAALALLAALQLWRLGRSWETVRQVTTKPGSVAPQLSIRLLQGGRTSLADARGHALVLVFWATWCGPCRTELPALERLHRRLAPAGIRFLAVSVDGEETRDRVPAFVRELGLTMPVGLDDGAASAAYHVGTIPHVVVIDPGGRVSAVLYGARAEETVAREISRAEGGKR